MLSLSLSLSLSASALSHKLLQAQTNHFYRRSFTQTHSSISRSHHALLCRRITCEFIPFGYNHVFTLYMRFIS